METETTKTASSGTVHAQRPLWHRFAGRLPAALKKWLLGRYWHFVEMREHLAEYSIEVVGAVPIHAARMFWLRHIIRIHIGPYSSIHRGCRIYRPDRVYIGNHTVVNYGVLLDGRRGLVIGDNASISEGAVILTLGHDIDTPELADKGGPVTIGDRVFIGSYARVLPDITIGEGAAVAAGAVVTHNVEPYTVVGGVPARFIRTRSRNLSYELHHQKPFG